MPLKGDSEGNGKITLVRRSQATTMNTMERGRANIIHRETPVECAAMAKPRRSGYLIASSENAGACQSDVPVPRIINARTVNQYQDDMPISR